MDITALTEAGTVEIIAGIVIGILSFIFGYRKIGSIKKNKNKNSEDKGKFNNIKTL